jgi:hypothetical protein
MNETDRATEKESSGKEIHSTNTGNIAAPVSSSWRRTATENCFSVKKINNNCVVSIIVITAAPPVLKKKNCVKKSPPKHAKTAGFEKYDKIYEDENTNNCICSLKHT